MAKHNAKKVQISEKETVCNEEIGNIPHKDDSRSADVTPSSILKSESNSNTHRSPAGCQASFRRENTVTEVRICAYFLVCDFNMVVVFESFISFICDTVHS